MYCTVFYSIKKDVFYIRSPFTSTYQGDFASTAYEIYHTNNDSYKSEPVFSNTQYMNKL